MNTEPNVAINWLSLALAPLTGKTSALGGIWVIKIGRNLVAVACDGRRAHFDWLIAKQVAHAADCEKLRAGVYAHAQGSLQIRNAMRIEQYRWPDRFPKLLARLENEPLFTINAGSFWQAITQLEESSGEGPVAVQLYLSGEERLLRLAADMNPLATRVVELDAKRPLAKLHAVFPSHYLLDALAPYQREEIVSVYIGRDDGRPERVLGIGDKGHAMAFLMPIEPNGKG